tara:strand:+ start:714 stop:839 length:126 start_codon:yes stop_codon:yes gene_type:complete
LPGALLVGLLFPQVHPLEKEKLWNCETEIRLDFEGKAFGKQ